VLASFAGSRILISAIEHPSVIEAAVNAEMIPVTADGVVDLPALEKLCASGEAPALVSVMLVNNETGVIQPVADIAAIAKKYGAKLHVDCVQGLGKIKFTRAILGADYMTFSAHKIGGPQGVGALVSAPGALLQKFIKGGGQERRQRAGTENVAAIAGFGAAVQQLASIDIQYIEKLRTRLESGLKAIDDSVVIFGAAADRVCNTTCFAGRHISAELAIMALDMEGFCVSSGSACSSGSIKHSHVLKAMAADEVYWPNALRISLGRGSTENEIDLFLKLWESTLTRVKKQ
jgi:cysteine desulfurase